MKRPSFVYFDLGNVLVHFDHAVAVRQVALVAQADEAEVRRAIFESGLEDRYETGLITGEQFVQFLRETLGRQLDTNAVLRAASDMFWENVSILPILERLRDQEMRMGLLSNTCEAHWSWIEQQLYRTVVGWFEELVLSYEVKAMKPHREIYEHATKLASVEPEAIFFIDDRIENVEGARSAGWRAFHYTDAASLQKVMEDWS